MMNWDNDWHGDGMGPLWWVFMIVMMVLFVGAVGYLIVMLTRHPSITASDAPPGAAPAPSGPALPEDILHERLARGEIDVDEYHQRIDALRAKRPG